MDDDPVSMHSEVPNIDVLKNTVHWQNQHWRMHHSLAGAFLQSLWQAQHHGEWLTQQDLAAACQNTTMRSLPNAKGMQRLVGAIEAFFEEWPSRHRPQLRTRPRRYTTGPWAMMIPAGSCWQTQLEPPKAQVPDMGDDPEALVDWAQRLMLADADLGKAHLYASAHDKLCALLPASLGGVGLDLPQDWTALVGLRSLQVRRRLGLLSEPGTHALMAAVNRLIPNLCEPWAAHVRMQLSMLGGRQQYDTAPNQAAYTLAFSDLHKQVKSAPSLQGLMEYSNLRAMSIRRQWHASKLSAHERNQAIADSVADSHAAYFWACASQDAYWQQATAINHAFLLQCAWEHKSEQQLRASTNSDALLLASLRWYALGDEWVRRFGLPQDSAWDFLMFGLLYRRALQKRPRLLQQHQSSWPAEADPRTVPFYEKAVELAINFGSIRQKIQAYDLAVWHAKTSKVDQNHTAWMMHCRTKRDQLLQTHPQVAEDLNKDKFTPA